MIVLRPGGWTPLGIMLSFPYSAFAVHMAQAFSALLSAHGQVCVFHPWHIMIALFRTVVFVVCYIPRS